MIVDIQLSPAVEPWEALRDGAQVAEEAGYGAIWVFDHFAGDLLGGSSMIECFTLLGAYAAATTRIGLGSLVVNVANRNPGVMAMAAASVQHISGGRLLLGIGAGAAPNTRWSAEHRALGIDLAPRLAERHRRFEEALDVLDDLWAPERHPDHASFPAPTPRPPVIVGLNSVRLAAVAGQRADGFNVRADHPDLEALIAAATDAHRASGHPERPFTVSVWTHFDEALGDPDHPQRRTWERIGVDRVVLTVLQPHDPQAIWRCLRG